MLLHKGKEYYPLELAQVRGKGNTLIYDRALRNKSYAYIAVTGTQEKENEE